MTDIFPRSNEALDAAVNEATTPERIRELVKSSMAADGLISRERGSDWGVRLLRQPEPEPEIPLPANGFKFEKEIHFAQSTGKRSLVIRANTLEDLQALENQIVGQ